MIGGNYIMPKPKKNKFVWGANDFTISSPPKKTSKKTSKKRKK